MRVRVHWSLISQRIRTRRKCRRASCLKSDGAALYTTTDLATIVERSKLFQSGSRSSMWWTSVRRCILSRCSAVARRPALFNGRPSLKFLGFGTMNGKDGKPFKTREGGVMRLENLIADINEEMFSKITENS